ncbi:hypothetical protein [Vagococcus fluvialis]|uniref:hypothetical protein n=1 Tax=Vagococcus fluvialis TaxID=2738 RepID=UPI003D10081D
MKVKLKVCLFFLLFVNLSACSSNSKKRVEESKETQITSSTFEITSSDTNSSSTKSVVTDTSSSRLESESERTTVQNDMVNLGTIYYQDLDINDPIQANSQYLGCYIVDDGSTVNLIPLMAATVQNLQIYTSGQGNEDYYQQFLNKAIETSNLTGGKPVSIFDREDGDVIITAENGEITYSK